MKEESLNELKKFILNSNEDFLILISNKGLYKRALSDLDKISQVTVDLDQELTVKIEDSILCRIGEDHKTSSCTCPSQKVCKHLLFSYLYLKYNFTKVFGEEPQGAQSFNREGLLNITLNDIIKKMGARLYNDTIFRLSFRGKVSFKEGNSLEVNYPEEGVSLRINGEAPFEDSLCSCKSERCSHLCESIIRYQIEQGGKSMNDFPYRREIEVNRSLVAEVQSLLGEIVETGLSRIPPSFLDQLELKAIHCHTASLSGLEKSLRALGHGLGEYFDRKASFSLDRFRECLVRGFTLSCQLLGSKNEEILVEQMGHRTAYVSLPPLSLMGMGSSAWQTPSGYMGITTYFLEKNQRWFTYTQSRPTFYKDIDSSFKEIYSELPWNSSTSMSQLSQSEIHLNHPLINRKRRISSREETHVICLDKTEITQATKGAYHSWLSCFEDFQKLKESGEMVALLKPESWGKGKFNLKKQVFSQSLFDSEGKELEIRLPYSGPSKRGIKNLESMEKTNRRPSHLLVKIYLGEGAILGVPLVGYFESGETFSLTMGEQ